MVAPEPTVLISARTPVALSDAFRAVAAARGQTLSQALRACVEHAVIEAASGMNDARPAGRPGDAQVPSMQATETVGGR